MAFYSYIAKDKDGSTLRGLLEAASESEASELLHAKGWIIISLEPSKGAVMGRKAVRKIKADDLVVFSRQLATMIDSGIPLAQALSILGEQVENIALRGVVKKVYQDIEAGTSFCDALGHHPQVFSELFLNMVRAGEASGMLNEVFDRLAMYLEKAAALNRKIRSSLVYPAVVVTIAVIITVFLLVKVVPTFKNIFEMLGGNLPLPTTILIAVSDALKRLLPVVLAALVAVVFALRKYINTPTGRYSFDTLKLNLAVMGPLFRKVALAKFSRTFATLIKSGVPMLKGLEIVAKTAGNKVIEGAILNCRSAVRDGEPLSQPLEKSGVFPVMVCRMIGVGEKTGQLEKMLGKIADFYEEQVDAAVAALTSLIEPLVIVFLGVVIGGIVISLFLPIFKITELIGK